MEAGVYLQDEDVAGRVPVTYMNSDRISLAPATRDSSVYAGEIEVELTKPRAVMFNRISDGPNYRWCGAWSTDQTVTITVAPVRSQQAKLVLTCTGDLGANRVTRGKEITCTARKEPADAPGELKITGWAFEERNRTDGVVTAGEWKGIMVHGGVIKVRGAIGSQPVDSARVAVSVERRPDWNVLFPSVPEPMPSEELPYPPVTVLGGHVGDGVFGLHTYGRTIPGSPIRAGTGPNKDWYYLRVPLELGPARIHINPGLYPGDPFYNAQRGGLDPARYVLCDRKFMDQARTFVVSHEQRHHQIAAEFFAGDGARMMEEASVFSPASSSVMDVAESLLASSEAELARRQNAFDASSRLLIPCKLQPIPHNAG